MIKVTIYNEFYHEHIEESVGKVYPDGIHSVIADFLGKNEDMEVRTVTLYEGTLTEEIIEDTDVLLWWGHMKHGDVPDEIVDKIYSKVHKGMGFIGLHSAHHSKPFRKLMGTSCNLRWREDGVHERVWNVCPTHPITKGISAYFDVPADEVYGEYFDIPTPDELLFITWHPGGEVMRSGCTFRRGAGKIFYFQPGHETYPIFMQKEVQTIITNAVRWAVPSVSDPTMFETLHPEPLESIEHLKNK